jgi:hypothetical protein
VRVQCCAPTTMCYHNSLFAARVECTQNATTELACQVRLEGAPCIQTWSHERGNVATAERPEHISVLSLSGTGGYCIGAAVPEPTIAAGRRVLDDGLRPGAHVGVRADGLDMYFLHSAH